MTPALQFNMYNYHSCSISAGKNVTNKGHHETFLPRFLQSSLCIMLGYALGYACHDVTPETDSKILVKLTVPTHSNSLFAEIYFLKKKQRFCIHITRVAPIVSCHGDWNCILPLSDGEPSGSVWWHRNVGLGYVVWWSEKNVITFCYEIGIAPTITFTGQTWHIFVLFEHKMWI